MHKVLWSALGLGIHNAECVMQRIQGSGVCKVQKGSGVQN